MFGYKDLKHQIGVTTEVECPVNGCSNRVRKQHKVFRAEPPFQCPEHKIYISQSTFRYSRDLDNILWKNEEDQKFLEQIKGSKRESRMAHDNSEDALTWNVFRYLEANSLLSRLLSSLADQDQGQAELIYWSYSQSERDVWQELQKARNEFGESRQRSSEPDLIAVTSQALFFLEAKLQSTNSTRPSDPKNRKKYLTGGQEWFKQVFASDFDTVAIQAQKYELLRFWLLGTWIASQMERDFYLINIAPSKKEMDIEQRFRPHLHEAENRRFKRLTWEEIYKLSAQEAPTGPEKEQWLSYFANRTVGYNPSHNLRKAFAL
jgi:hypothetical protein